VASLKAAGVSGVTRYLSWLPNSKVIQQAEFNRLTKGGVSVTLNWEFSARDWMGGGSVGQSHAAEAVRQARALGYAKGCSIIGSADFDMTAAEWGSACRAYAIAFATGIRAAGYVAGVYGPWDVLARCRALGGFSIFWQAGMSTAWSGGRNAQRWPGAHLRQLRGGTVGGVSVDVNEVLIAAYGQYLPGSATPAAVIEPEENRVLTVVQEKGSKDVYVGDGMALRLLSPAEVDGFQAWAVNHWPAGTVYLGPDPKKPVVIQQITPGSLGVFGQLAPPVVAPSAEAIAAALIAQLKG
jgi:hypothetical protein